MYIAINRLFNYTPGFLLLILSLCATASQVSREPAALRYAAQTVAGERIAVDAQGAVYIVSTIRPAQFPSVRGESDILITKLNPAGVQQVFRMQVGGVDADQANSIAVDASGAVFVAGRTYSTDFTASGASAGVCFKSADRGANWGNSGRGLPAFLNTLGSLVVDPNNPAVIYGGMRDNGENGPASKLYRSADGGENWTAISIGGERPVRPLAVAPGDSNLVFASASIGLRQSTDGGATWSDAGLNAPGIRVLHGDRQNPRNFYAMAETGIHKSVDGGVSWSVANNGLPPQVRLWDLAASQTAPFTLYALLSSPTLPRAIFRSTDGAASWAPVEGGIESRSAAMLAVDPRNSSVVYAGTNGGLYRSVDAGKTWQSAGLEDYQVTILAIDPLNPSILYASTPRAASPGRLAGGIFKSLDGGMNWSLLDNSLKQSAVEALAIDPGNPANLYAGAAGNADAFVLKLKPSGDGILYATTFGEIGTDGANALALDQTGNAYVTGEYRLPLTQGSEGFHTGSGDGFLAKLNARGDGFAYFTRMPGVGKALAVDAADRVYVTGSVLSFLRFPVKNGFQPVSGGIRDAFLHVVDAKRTGEASLLYSTYLGGSRDDEGEMIAVDAKGQVYLGGSTVSEDSYFASAARLTPHSPSFLARIDPNRAGDLSFVWLSYFGDGQGRLSGLAVDAASNLYVTGVSSRTTFPVTPGALQPGFGGGVCDRVWVCNGVTPSCNCVIPTAGCGSYVDVFCGDVTLSKINAEGTAIVSSTYLGANGVSEEGKAIALDASGNVYLTGSGLLAGTPGAYRAAGASGFIAKLMLDARNTAVTSVSAANYLGPELAAESLTVGFLDAFGAGADRLQAKVRDSKGAERDAMIFFSGAGQVNFQVPPGTANGDATVRVMSGGAAIASGALRIVDVAPGLFTFDATGRGLPAAFAQRIRNNTTIAYEPIARFDAQQNRFVPVPIDFGPEGDVLYLVLYGTGFRNRSALSAVRVTLGGAEMTINYAGPQLQLIGLDQINVFLPRTLAGRGDVDLAVTVDGKAANPVNLSIR